MRSRLVVMMMLVAVALCGAVPVGAADKPDGKIKIFVGILPVAYSWNESEARTWSATSW